MEQAPAPNRGRHGRREFLARRVVRHGHVHLPRRQPQVRRRVSGGWHRGAGEAPEVRGVGGSQAIHRQEHSAAAQFEVRAPVRHGPELRRGVAGHVVHVGFSV